MSDSSLRKVSVIDRITLDEKNYAQSLVSAGILSGLITNEEADRIYISFLTLLGKRADKFCEGKSSSVPEETAEALLRGALYLIGIRLKEYSSPDDALELLKAYDLEPILEGALDTVKAKLTRLKGIYRLLLDNMADIPSLVYNDTLIKGISAFFTYYNPDFFADNHIICGDYPICKDISRFTGFEFMREYIICNYCENKFLSRFDSHIITALLSYIEPGYKELIQNLFEPVLCAAVCCVLTGTNPLFLCIGENGAQKIQSVVNRSDEKELYGIVYDSVKELIRVLEITNDDVQIYMLESIPSVIGNIVRSANAGTLSKLAPEFPVTDITEKISFDYGIRTSSKRYRSILSELSRADSAEDKAGVIKRRVHSLSDFEDILIDADFTDKELSVILTILSPVELSALLAHRPLENRFENDESEAEIRLRLSINNLIKSLPAECRKQILKDADSLSEGQ